MSPTPTGRPHPGWGGPRTSRHRGGERLIWPIAAVALAIAAYGLLPDTLLVLPRVVVPAICTALLAGLLITNPKREGRRAQFSRWIALVLACVLILTNLAALGLLVTTLESDAPGRDMLIGAMQVWFTNVVGFALLFWELDRGGPVARHVRLRSELPLADWRFSQDENDDAIGEVGEGSAKDSGWMAEFPDYAYLSLTNSSAFSPTDTMPLSTRAKALMGLQASAALLTSLLVVARAVGSMGGGGS